MFSSPQKEVCKGHHRVQTNTHSFCRNGISSSKSSSETRYIPSVTFKLRKEWQQFASTYINRQEQ